MKATSTQAMAVLAFAFAIGLPEAARASPECRVQPTLAPLYARYAEAVRTREDARWQAMLAPGFVMVDTNGKLHDAVEMKRYVAVNSKTIRRVVSYSNDIQTCTRLRSGDLSAIILQKYARMQAPMEAPNEVHEIRTSVIQREIWRRIGTSWRLRRVEEILKGPVYFDGKVVE